MLILIVGLLLFLGVHSLRIVPGARPALRQRLGARTYRLGYTVVSLAGFGLIIAGMIQTHPGLDVWNPPGWGRHAAFVLVPLGLILIVASFAPGHIRHSLRHPMLAGVILWSLAHLLANSELNTTLLFGGFLIWSVITFISSWMRETPPREVKGWGGDLTAIVLGFLAALVLMNVHQYLFGVPIIG